MTRKRSVCHCGRWKRYSSASNDMDGDEDANDQRDSVIRREVAREVFQDFCDSSTIHGLKYLRTSSIHEKIMWIIIFIISIVFCSLQIHTIWKRWNQDPVIVSFNENLVPIVQIPFPAITICHQVKTRKSAFNYGAILSEIEKHGIAAAEVSDLDLQQFQLIASICLKDHTSYESRGLLNRFKGYNRKITKQLLPELAPLLNETLKLCIGVLEARKWNCADGFGRLLTEDGLCYSFNLLNTTELLHEGTIFHYNESFPPTKLNWSLDINGIDYENFKQNMSQIPFYPIRVFSTGEQLVLKVASKKSNLDPACQGLGDRFRIYLHHPYELPWAHHQFYDVDVKEIIALSVIPKRIIASPKLKTAYSAEKRRCYFEGERQLKYFRHYTKRNCELECWVNMTQKYCGCVQFWMPHHNSSQRFCGLRDFQCMRFDSRFYLYRESAAANLNITNHRSPETFSCNCWSTCDSLDYEAQPRYSRLTTANERKYAEEDVSHRSEELDGVYEVAKIKIKFKESEFPAMKRSELYGLTDFIANCGGLLGLFMGVSLLSFVEIIYFFTVRFVKKFRSKTDEKREEN